MTLRDPLLRARSAPRGGKRALTISVSRKEAPRAVMRNRIRRRIRAAIAKVGAKPERPTMLIAGKRVASAPFGEIVEEIRRIFRNHD